MKTIDESPSITDTVLFDILTPDINGCQSQNPYVVNSVTIYSVQRDFALGNPVEYDNTVYDTTQLATAQAAAQLACQSPTVANITAAQQAQQLAASHATVAPVYFNEAIPVNVVGNSDSPAWLSTDISNALIQNISTGHFQYTWQPTGMREGDYFICWTWTMLPAGVSQSAHSKFTLLGDTQLTTSIPTHQTAPNKYQTLLEQYLPPMYTVPLTSNDQTSTVLTNFNNAIAQGFTDLENLANQIVDLLDANATAEAILPLLARLFNLKLRSGDPTRWRRQIKRAIPLFKSKGTINGLGEAFQQAGMNMSKFTRMWQVISPHTWQDQFNFDGSNAFILSKVALTLGPNNFVLSLRHASDSVYNTVSSASVTFATNQGITTMTWVGTLLPGDSILVLYLVNPIIDNNTQLIENYIRTLPLADQRDERAQAYPLKNWNVRMIEEDDPMLSVVIPNRYPYHSSVIFGKVRTEFPYSENMYMMDEYNGSLRDSSEPCDIDKDFLDPCSQCQGSKFNIDLEIQNLSNDRLLEAQDIIKEFVPFHAQLHSINFSGSIDEFMQPPVEAIECLIQYTGQEEVVAGAAQYTFGRAMFGGFDVAQVKRNVLASSTLVVNNATGTFYNDNIVISCPLVNFNDIGMDLDGDSNVLEILGPSPLVGNYTLSSPQNHYANIAPISPTTISEPISRSPFTFRLSNDVYANTTANITQNNLIVFTDVNVSFSTLGVISDWNITHGQSGGPWQIKIPAYSLTPYTIHEVLPNGEIVLNYDSTLPVGNVSNVTYQLLTDTNVQMASSTTGVLTTTSRGLVDISSDSLITDIRTVTRSGQWLYDVPTNAQYEISDFITTQTFNILGWGAGNVGSHTIHIYNRLVNNQIGYLDYIGMELLAGTNLEVSLGINNGTNPPPIPLEDSHFKENFLVVVGSDYYSIVSINGSNLTLIGNKYDWTTLAAGGTPLTYSIYQYIKQPYTIQGMEFDYIDRRGKEIITNDINKAKVFGMLPPHFLFAQLNKPSNEVVEVVTQNESITYTIEYADGTKETNAI